MRDQKFPNSRTSLPHQWVAMLDRQGEYTQLFFLLIFTYPVEEILEIMKVESFINQALNRSLRIGRGILIVYGWRIL